MVGLALSLLWRGFDPWPGNFRMRQVQPKKEKRNCCIQKSPSSSNLHCGQSPLAVRGALAVQKAAGTKTANTRACARACTHPDGVFLHVVQCYLISATASPPKHRVWSGIHISFF